MTHELAGDNDLGGTIEIIIKFCNKGITAAAPSILREKGSISGSCMKGARTTYSELF